MNPSSTARQHGPRTMAAPHPGPGTLSRSILAAAAAALLAALALFVAPSASAHDALIGSTPKDGATVSSALDSVELDFSGALKPIGNQVSLSDAEGAKHDAETSISGNTLTVDFGAALPAGQYTLVWRVVSSDGHPIEGTTANQEALSFTVKGGAAASSAPAMSSPATAASAAASTEASPDPSSAAPAAGSEQDDSSGGLPGAVIWIIIAVAVIGAAATVVAKARRQGGSGR
ncbi:copper resistance protein CopC [Micrococcaceae bacterium RIT802]|nr:copper resistance protein CopC [Micrococcaceae bacterium RIT 802]